MDKFFKITERGSNYRKEIVGGLRAQTAGWQHLAQTLRLSA